MFSHLSKAFSPVAIALTTIALSLDPQMGKVVSAGGGRITIAVEQGREQTYDVAPDAVIMLNDQLSKLEKLTMGDEAKLTLETKNSKQVVTEVDAKSAHDKAAKD